MNKKRLWLIPAIFFAVCCVLNLYGCLTEGRVENLVKPALMPLLCVTTVCFLLGRCGESNQICFRKVSLLVAAQLFGFAGDTMLMDKSFIFFAGGIGLFLLGHVCYISLFGGESWKGLRFKHWALALPVLLAATAGLVMAIGINGAMLAPMGVYGFTLMLLIFSAFAGVVRRSSVQAGSMATWLILLCGAMLFAFSDSLIAIRTFGSLSDFMGGFGVMSTYLLAQSLLAVGGVRLILNR